ncbi:MAG TPA: chromate transporter [Bacilli bacterium]|nr:chromate transporter [Bacilli bacterium]
MGIILKMLDIFWTFFKIGLFTFGGGYAMIPLMQSEVISKGWMGYEEVVRFIAISESTPGPFAINMATFIGSSQLGILGSLTATFAVVLPSFLIILVIASIFKSFEKNRYVQAAIKGVQPTIVALIVSTGVILVIKNIFPLFPHISSDFDRISLVLMFDAGLIYWGHKIVFKKKLSPIILIVIAAALGIIAYA